MSAAAPPLDMPEVVIQIPTDGQPAGVSTVWNAHVAYERAAARRTDCARLLAVLSLPMALTLVPTALREGAIVARLLVSLWTVAAASLGLALRSELRARRHLSAAVRRAHGAELASGDD